MHSFSRERGNRALGKGSLAAEGGGQELLVEKEIKRVVNGRADDIRGHERGAAEAFGPKDGDA